MFATTQRSARVALGVALAALVSAALPTAASAQKLVIEAGKVITQAGEPIDDGVIVIDGGRITAVGKRGEVEVPWDAPVLGGPELVAFPGFVEAHSNDGTDRPNENIDIAAFLDLRDSIDPVSFFYEDCRRAGITTINVQHGWNCVVGARGIIVRPVGMTVGEMTLRGGYGLKMSARAKNGKSPATQAQALREAFGELRRYLGEVVQDKKDGKDLARREAMYQGRELEGEKAKGRPMGGTAWKVEGLELVPRGEIDEKQEPLLDVVEGRYDVFFECGSARDVPLAIEIARDNGFLENTVLVVGGDCWKAADEIAKAGLSVIHQGPLTHTERDPMTGEETETFALGVYEEKGIPYALSSQSTSTNALWFQAAMATGLGVDRQKALDAVTTVPAEMIGLADRVGSLEPGKDGNVVLFTGDPLSVTSWVQYVVVDGEKVYDRAEDLRNKHLIEGQEPRGGAPEAAASRDDEKQDEKDDEEKDEKKKDDDEGEEDGE